MAKKRSIPVLFTAAEIAERVEALAHEIAGKMGTDFFIVSLLRGSFMFTADLVREFYAIGLHPQIDFMTLTSYGSAKESSGAVTINRDLIEEVKDKHILIVDDILETGRTLHHAAGLMKARGAASVKLAVLLEKPGKRAVEINADFVGFSIPRQVRRRLRPRLREPLSGITFYRIPGRPLEPIRDRVGRQHIVVARPRADDGETAAIDQHFGNQAAARCTYSTSSRRRRRRRAGRAGRLPSAAAASGPVAKTSLDSQTGPTRSNVALRARDLFTATTSCFASYSAGAAGRSSPHRR